MTVVVARVVIPGTSTDEGTIYEVLPAVIPVGRAGVRIIAEVAIGACGSRAHADRACTNGNANANLRIGTGGGEKKNS